ncbi:MAG: hypothetical protein IAF02_11075 [Anaerolineae bacterium]|nr:hypothetical protein [Anaerolineae bacterium]
MYQIDVSTISGFLVSLWAIITGVLSFDADAYIAVLTQDGGGRMALAVLFVSTLSLSIGQSVVLFANRVGRRRFVLSLMLSATLLVIGVYIWATAVWLLAALVFDAYQSFRNVFIVVSLSYAPLVYGFLVLLPYLGNIIYMILRVWIFLVLLMAVQALFRFGWFDAILCSVLGWFVLELIVRIPMITAVEQWLWRLFSGKKALAETHDIVTEFVQSVRTSAQAWEDEDAE